MTMAIINGTTLTLDDFELDAVKNALNEASSIYRQNINKAIEEGNQSLADEIENTKKTIDKIAEHIDKYQWEKLERER